MTQNVFDSDTRALRKPDDENLLWSESAALRCIQNQPMRALDRTSQLRLIRFNRLHVPARIPETLTCIRSKPPSAADFQGVRKIKHLLLGPRTSVKEDTGAIGETFRLSRLAQAG